MKPQALAKLDLLAAAKETALLDSLARHNEALRRYEAQQEVLSSYRNRLGAMWRGAATVQAGEAKRAEHFSTQAEDATLQLAQAIEAERGQPPALPPALAELTTPPPHPPARQARPPPPGGELTGTHPPLPTRKRGGPRSKPCTTGRSSGPVKPDMFVYNRLGRAK